MELYLFLFLASLASSSLLAGGPIVSFSQYPSTVLVVGRNPGSNDVATSCTGSILQGSFVLTTATCVSQNMDYFVLVPNPSGSVQLGGSYDEYRVSTISRNPAASSASRPYTLSFDQGGQTVPVLATLNTEDVAVLRLSRQITSPGARAISLSSTEAPSNSMVAINGYGLAPLYSLTATQTTRLIAPSASDPQAAGLLFLQGTEGVGAGDHGGPWMLGGNQIAISAGALVVPGSQTLYSVGIPLSTQMTFINSIIIVSSGNPSPVVVGDSGSDSPPVIVVVANPPTAPIPEPEVAPRPIVVTPPPTQPIIVTQPVTPPRTVIVATPDSDSGSGARVVATPNFVVEINGASSTACATLLVVMICLVHLI